MKRAIATAIVLMAASVIVGQQAQVIQLSTADANFAKEKWQALQDAQADWDHEVQRIQKKYTKGDQIQAAGFENGIDFSSDFKYIVPKVVKSTTPCLNNSNFFSTGCVTLTPYVGGSNVQMNGVVQ